MNQQLSYVSPVYHTAFSIPLPDYILLVTYLQDFTTLLLDGRFVISEGYQAEVLDHLDPPSVETRD